MYQSPIKISIIISSSLVLLIEQNTLFLAPHRTVPATIFLGGMRLLKLELRDRYFATFIPGTPDCLSRTTQHHVVGLDNRLIWGHQKITFFKSLADSNKESNQQTICSRRKIRTQEPWALLSLSQHPYTHFAEHESNSKSNQPFLTKYWIIAESLCFRTCLSLVIRVSASFWLAFSFLFNKLP